MLMVKCVENRLASLQSPEILEHASRYVHQDSVELVVGQRYPVFGVSFRDGIPWFLICESITDDYPTPHCSAFFELTDASIGVGWSLSLNQTNAGSISLLPDEWANDETFLEKLVDGDSAAVSHFNEMKALANSTAD